MSTVYVLGSLNMDTTYYVSRIPGSGVTLASSHCESAPGGKGLNQAVAVSWTGVKTDLIGSVGDDANGAAMEKVLSGYPIDCSRLMRVGAPTGSAVILVNDRGENCIVVNGGANRQVPVRDTDFRPGDYLVAQLETNIDAVTAYFSMAKARGAYTVLNLSPSQPVPEELLADTDLLIVNEHEAGAITGRDIRSAEDAFGCASQLSTMGISRTLVTLGENGVVVLDGDSRSHIPGEKVTARDTQGAGDAFLGVAVGSLASGMSLCEAARRANHVAALCVQVEGSTLISLRAIGKDEQ